jgi:hypothetical protein
LGASSTSGATPSCGPPACTTGRARGSRTIPSTRGFSPRARSNPSKSRSSTVRIDRYTTLAAEAKWAAGKGDGGFLPGRILWEFLDRAFLRLGFLDGSAGLTFAALSSANTLLKFLKLREMERAIARGERTPPEGVRIEDTAAIRIRALMRAP